jgi:uncharacterized membrane protein YjgN (DUF898 family)
VGTVHSSSSNKNSSRDPDGNQTLTTGLLASHCNKLFVFVVVVVVVVAVVVVVVVVVVVAAAADNNNNDNNNNNLFNYANLVSYEKRGRRYEH